MFRGIERKLVENSVIEIKKVIFKNKLMDYKLNGVARLSEIRIEKDLLCFEVKR